MNINLNIVLGAIVFVLSVIQLIPMIKRRAAERGLSGGNSIPLILAAIGFAVFLVGIYELRIEAG